MTDFALSFSGAVATFSQTGYHPLQMLDGDYSPNNGWAIYQGETLSETALLTLGTPLAAGHYSFTFTFYQYHGNPGHSLGDFGLSYATDQSPNLSSVQTPLVIIGASSLNGTTFTFPEPEKFWREERFRVPTFTSSQPKSTTVTALDGSQSLQFLTAPNYETDPHSYAVEVAAFDGINTTAKTITVNLTDVNDNAPVITTAATQTLAENTTLVAALISTDLDTVGTNPAIFSVTGGADQALFDIVNGNLVFKTAPDYETDPHSYDIELSAFDGANTAAKTITVDVTNISGVTINGTGGKDTINATITVAGQPFPTNEEDTINAAGGNDLISSLGGNDWVNGGAGADSMFGGTGNDTYVVDNNSDVVNETGSNGSDTVQSSITFNLSDAIHAKGDIEDLTLTGTAAINGTGNAFANAIAGNSGNNVLAGLGGADTLDGGGGTDTATYAASASGVNVSLATGLGSGGDAEGDTLFNFENLTGSAFSDTLEGNTANNILAGGNGIDTVSYAHATVGVTVSLSVTNQQNTGGAGTDTLSSFENLAGSDFNDFLTGSTGSNVIDGGDGNDTIKGGGGQDILTGGAGNDKFVFATLSDSTVAAPDRITVFVHEQDSFDFSAIDANTSSKAKGDQPFLFAGQNFDVVANSVTWFETGTGNTIVQADVNGNTVADISIELTGINLHLTQSDFIL